MSRDIKQTEQHNLTVVLLLLAVGLLIAVLANLNTIKQTLKAQLEYEANADMCWQQIEDYSKRGCYVERSASGDYYWYSENINLEQGE